MAPARLNPALYGRECWGPELVFTNIVGNRRKENLAAIAGRLEVVETADVRGW